MKRAVRNLCICLGVLWIAGCSSYRKVARLKKENVNALISVTDSFVPSENDNAMLGESEDKPLVVSAINENGVEFAVAEDRLEPVIVRARYKNVAERCGKLQIAFEVTVPASVQDKGWQVRLTPRLFWEADSLELDKVYVTGKDYRDAQLRGYERYRKYFNSIIPDSVDFVKAFAHWDMLQVFLRRNLPDKEFGITEEEATEHYIKQWLVKANRKKKERLAQMFGKYVKIPVDSFGVRLDTVIALPGGDIVYNYVQTLNAQKNMKRIKVAFSGGIYSLDRQLYAFPATDSLLYYITSLAQLADRRPLYSGIVEDTLYARGVKALTDRDYKTAIEILRPYKNINTVLAYLCGDYNNSALEVAARLEQTPLLDYIKSVIYWRLHREEEALECFRNSVEEDSQMLYRAALDPEACELLIRYNLLK